MSSDLTFITNEPGKHLRERFSYVKMEYAAVETEAGKVGVETRLTPARRFSYIVGEGESCHTAQSRFLELLQDTENLPTLAQIEDAFSVEAVTKEFFNQYAALFGDIEAALQRLAAKDPVLGKEFKAKNVSTVDFAKKLMGQIVFLYFLQKKGWLGVEKGKDWGTGPHDFLRRLARGDYGAYDNFFNDVLEPLFYDTLATDRGHEAWCNRFKCRIPFLNGGLFEPLGNYDWRKTDIILPNRHFTKTDRFDELITGTGVLDVFDRYNFTVNEAEPLEKEVAIDPEMLGKVFENLIEENRRKGLGSYYTPREIVHYMCQESLINYLDTAINTRAEPIGREKRKQAEFGDEKAEQTLLTSSTRREILPRADIETFVHLGDQISHYEAVETRYAIKMPKSIEQHARLIDDKLAGITICDPAVGYRPGNVKSGGDERVYNRPRIVVRQIGRYPEGTLCPAGLLTLNTIYNVFLNIERFDLKFLLAVINSPVIRFYWLKRFYDNKETFPKIKKQPLESIPIKDVQAREQKSLIGLVDRILAAKAREASADVSAWEREIGQLVYALYGLTPEEIQIVEGATANKR